MRTILPIILILLLVVHVYPAHGQSSSERLIKIPTGTQIEVELVHLITSESTEKGDLLTFRSLDAVKIDGVVVIEPGARCTAVVVKAKRRRHWGRGGQLAFTMRDIVAVDEQRVPLQFMREVTGDGRVAEVASAIAATGVLLWPIAPLSLLWGLKKGEDVVIPVGKRFVVTTRSDVMVRVSQSK